MKTIGEKFSRAVQKRDIYVARAEEDPGQDEMERKEEVIERNDNQDGIIIK